MSWGHPCPSGLTYDEEIRLFGHPDAPEYFTCESCWREVSEGEELCADCIEEFFFIPQLDEEEILTSGRSANDH